MNIAEEWKSWTPFHKTLLLASAGLLVTSAVLGYGAVQSRSAAREAAGRAENTMAQVQSLERQVAKPVPAPDLSAVGRAIPNEWEMARFFADLAVAAKTRRVTVVSVTPAQPPEDRGAYTPPTSRPGPGESAPKPPAQAAPAAGGTGPASGPAAQSSGSGAGGQGGQGPSPGQSPASGQGPGQGNNPGGGTPKSGGAAPPPAIPGLYTLELSIEAEGSGPDLLAFLDELQAMPRFVWINEYTLDFPKEPQSPAPSKLNVKLTLYSHAPWDAKAANETPWPFPMEPAGNPEAFGRQ